MIGCQAPLPHESGANNLRVNVMLISNRPGETFEDVLGKEFRRADSIKIASGYLGFEAFDHYGTRLESIVKAGGVVQIIGGLGAWEGVSSALKKKLERLHKFLAGHSPNSGIFFCVKERYHGKIFLIENSKSRIVSVGSSNFSPTGIGGWLEANWVDSNTRRFRSTEEYFNYLLRNSARIIDISLPVKGTGRKASREISKQPRTSRLPPDVLRLPVAFEIEIKTPPKSNINLTFGRGRRTAGGRYILRPYYESELNVPKRAMVPPLTRYVPNTVDPYRIKICGTDGVLMDANFNRKSPVRGDTRPLHEVGGDFQTTPRELLGKFIKDALIESGVLIFGAQVTAKTLEEYGSSSLKFRQIGKDSFHVEF